MWQWQKCGFSGSGPNFTNKKPKPKKKNSRGGWAQGKANNRAG
jgi:hypothetical protein